MLKRKNVNKERIQMVLKSFDNYGKKCKTMIYSQFSK